MRNHSSELLFEVTTTNQNIEFRANIEWYIERLIMISSTWSCLHYELTCIANIEPCLGHELTLDNIKHSYLQDLKA